MENPIKMDDLRVPPFSETTKYWRYTHFPLNHDYESKGGYGAEANRVTKADMQKCVAQAGKRGENLENI